MKILLNYFLRGLLVILPVVVTVYTAYFIFFAMDNFLSILVPSGGSALPGTAILFTFALISLVGFLASSFIARTLIGLMDSLFTHLPVVKILYTAVRDLLTVLVDKKKVFGRPVLVNVTPDGSIKVMGFVSKEDMASWDIKDHMAVYVQQSYNFAGHVLLVPKDRVRALDRDNSEVMAFLVSGGMGSGKSAG